MAEKPDVGEDQRLSIKITQLLEKSLECPVCLEVARPPVQQCTKGHIICSGCLNKMVDKICPLCSQAFVLETSTCLNSLLEALPRLCKFSEAGCKEVCVPGDDDEHEDFCGFRPITCRHCQVKVMLNEMKKHYQENHTNTVLFDKMSCVMTWKKFDPYEERCSNSSVFIDGHFFYIKYHNKPGEKCLETTCEAFYVNKPKANYYYVTFKYEKKAFVQQKTIRPITMKGECDSSGLNNDEVKENIEVYRMNVPQTFLEHFMNEEKTLKNAYSFFTL